MAGRAQGSLMQSSRISRRGMAALVCLLALSGAGMLLARDFFLEEGTEMAMRLRTSVDTKFNQKGDRIICTVEDPIAVDNVEVIPSGTRVHGRIGDIQKPGRFGKGGKMVLTFESIEVPGAGSVPISGSLVDLYDPENEEDKKQTKDLKLGQEGEISGGGPKVIKRAATIGAGAGIGAAAGGGLGAGIGVAVGVATAYVFWKGKEVTLPAGTGIVMRIDRGVALSIPDMPKAAGNGSKPR